MADKKQKRRARRGSSSIHPNVLVATLLFVAAAAAAWFLWVSPTKGETETLRQQTDNTVVQTSQLRNRIHELESGAASGAAELLAQARHLDKMLPSAIDETAVAGSVPALAAQHGLVVDKMDPAPPTQSSSLEFAAAVSGSFEQVVSFIQDLSSNDNTVGLMKVSALAVNITDSMTTAEFTLTAFYSSSPELQASSTQ